MLAHGVNVKESLLNVDFAVYCASHDYVSLLGWAKSNKCPMEKTVGWAAARHGHLKSIQWTIEYNYADMVLYQISLSFGHLHIAQWLHECNYAFGPNVYVDAATGGHVHLLKWFKLMKYPFSGDICYYAVIGENVACLQWALENGFPYSKGVLLHTAQTLHYHGMIDWILSNVPD